jgi:hypothetical protein
MSRRHLTHRCVGDIVHDAGALAGYFEWTGADYAWKTVEDPSSLCARHHARLYRFPDLADPQFVCMACTAERWRSTFELQRFSLCRASVCLEHDYTVQRASHLVCADCLLADYIAAVVHGDIYMEGGFVWLTVPGRGTCPHHHVPLASDGTIEVCLWCLRTECSPRSTEPIVNTAGDGTAVGEALDLINAVQLALAGQANTSTAWFIPPAGEAPIEVQVDGPATDLVALQGQPLQRPIVTLLSRKILDKMEKRK